MEAKVWNDVKQSDDEYRRFSFAIKNNHYKKFNKSFSDLNDITLNARSDCMKFSFTIFMWNKHEQKFFLKNCKYFDWPFPDELKMFDLNHLYLS